VLIGQAGQELDCEEWITGGLFVEELCQRLSAGMVTMKGGGHEVAYIGDRERFQHNRRYDGPCLAD
jgi:hypothetical protein